MRCDKSCENSAVFIPLKPARQGHGPKDVASLSRPDTDNGLIVKDPSEYMYTCSWEISCLLLPNLHVPSWEISCLLLPNLHVPDIYRIRFHPVDKLKLAFDRKRRIHKLSRHKHVWVLGEC